MSRLNAQVRPRNPVHCSECGEAGYPFHGPTRIHWKHYSREAERSHDFIPPTREEQRQDEEARQLRGNAWTPRPHKDDSDEARRLRSIRAVSEYAPYGRGEGVYRR